MEIIDILNSAPAGVVIGIVVTKSFDIFNKRLEYSQEAKKIRYNRKLEKGEQAVKYLQTYNDQLLIIRELIEQMLANDNFNRKMLGELWQKSHKQIENLGDKTMEMMNSSYFYYDIPRNEEYNVLVKELYNNISNLLNMVETNDYTNSHEILINYKVSIQKTMDFQNEILALIIKQSKK